MALQEILKGSGNGLQPHVPFLSSPDGMPLPKSTGEGGEEGIMRNQDEAQRIIVCKLCGGKQMLNLKYQLEIDICSCCAERVANLYCYEHSGAYVTWPNPATKAKPPTKGFSATQKLDVWRRDGFRCVKCGSDSDLSVDHIHPRSKGGSDDKDNLRTLCRSCNSSKAAKIEQAA